MFDFESILAHAEKDADEEIQKLTDLSTSSTATKRRVPTASSEDTVVQVSKRRRTAHYNEEALHDVNAPTPHQWAKPIDYNSSEQPIPSHDNSTSEPPSTNSFPDFNAPFDASTFSSDTSDPPIQELFPLSSLYEAWESSMREQPS